MAQDTEKQKTKNAAAYAKSVAGKTSLQKTQDALNSLNKFVNEYMAVPENAARVQLAEAKAKVNAAKIDTSLTPAERVRAAAEAAREESAAKRALEAEKKASSVGVDTSGMTSTQIKTATRVAAAEIQTNLLKGEKPTPPPEDDNFTYDYIWHVFAGGGGEWRLIKTPKYKGSGGKGGSGGDGNGGDGNTVVNGGQTTNIDVLKSLLRGMGFTTSLIDSSADFLNRLLKDGLDYDNAISIFLDSKEYTFKNGQKVTSPFYTAYGYLNEGLTVPKTASELFNAVEGYREVVAKYALNEKFLTSDSLKKYIKNNVSVSDLDERANAARLKSVNADKSYTDALMQLGYIKAPTDLTDFFLNPDIGKEALEQNRVTAAFSAEAVRRAQQGIKFDATRFKEISAGLLGKGLNEAQVGAMAATGFETIGEQLAPTTKLAQMYEKLPASDAMDIQKELEAEQFLGTASQRRKRVAQREVVEFMKSSGTARGVSLGRGAAGAI